MTVDMRKVRGLLVTVFHLAIIGLSLALAFWLRFEFYLAPEEVLLLLNGLAVAVPIKIATFVAGGLQRGWWRYAGLSDLARLYVVNLAASGLAAVGVSVMVGPQFPRSVYVIDFLLCFLLSAGVRFSVRLYNETLKSELAAARKGVLIYGAGAAGRTLVREVRTNRSLGYQVVGFIDDNPSLRSSRIMDIPVLGNGRQVAAIVERYRHRTPSIDEIVIAMPSATGLQMREAHAKCRASGVPCKTVPGMGDLLTGNYLSAQLRNISLDDLLGREQIRLEENRIKESIAGRSLLITGAAGSIGSELCRQTARFQPDRLVLFDQAESELFKMDRELRQAYPDHTIIPVIGDIRDIRSVEETIRSHSIDSIYHAAAYKHVPLMEVHVIEAVRNNIIGTWNLVRAAEQQRVSSFLMISSDKAVNPTSVMGATKRIAELIVAAAANGGGGDIADVSGDGTNGDGSGGRRCKFVSVRFGNVLGSNGSVVPIFQSQISAGGPVTVTHPDMRRYFMSVREAVLLVLQASTMGRGSEIFVLDMGEAVRILDLAHNMIQLAGLVPGEDIEIRFTGLRPGEKLFEELALDGENIMPTYHEKVRIFHGSSMERQVLDSWLTRLQLLIAQRDSESILRHLAVLVPEYRPQGRPKPAREEAVPRTA